MGSFVLHLEISDASDLNIYSINSCEVAKMAENEKKKNYYLSKGPSAKFDLHLILTKVGKLLVHLT